MHKEGVDDFVHTTRYFGCDEIFYQKGIYPYDYVNGQSKLDETALPPKVAFYNSLTDEQIDDEQYVRARNVGAPVNEDDARLHKPLHGP